MTSSQRQVGIVVVTYRSAGWIGACLASVQQHCPADWAIDIVVVDNASPDQTVAEARAAAPTATFITLSENRGFAAAANLGAAAARGDRLLFLNPDAQLLDGTLARLSQTLDDDRRLAAVGPRLTYMDGTPQDAAFAYPTLMMTWLEFFPRPKRLLGGRLNGRLQAVDGRPVAIDHPLGACMLVRRRAWEDVGPFDEQFFLYCDEVDWCRRAQLRGWVIAHEPRAVALHESGASSAQVPGPSLVHLYQSRLRLHRKHRPLWFRIGARFITCLGLAQEQRRDRTRVAQGGAHHPERAAALDRARHLGRAR